MRGALGEMQQSGYFEEGEVEEEPYMEADDDHLDEMEVDYSASRGDAAGRRRGADRCRA